MSHINATVNAVQTAGAVIAMIGDENTYVSLRMRRLGAKIEMTSDLTVYYPLSGHYEAEELGREIADDEDEAIEIATDLEYAAQDRLKAMDIDYWKEPTAFPEALMLAFNAHTAHAIAAE
jgi:hypothetical protein